MLNDQDKPTFGTDRSWLIEAEVRAYKSSAMKLVSEKALLQR